MSEVEDSIDLTKEGVVEELVGAGRDPFRFSSGTVGRDARATAFCFVPPVGTTRTSRIRGNQTDGYVFSDEKGGIIGRATLHSFPAEELSRVKERVRAVAGEVL